MQRVNERIASCHHPQAWNDLLALAAERFYPKPRQRREVPLGPVTRRMWTSKVNVPRAGADITDVGYPDPRQHSCRRNPTAPFHLLTHELLQIQGENMIHVMSGTQML